MTFDDVKEIVEKVKVLWAFDRYLTRGYYPFYREPGSGYEMRISQLVNQVLESDYPAIEDVSTATIRKARRMLRILSETPPQTLNLSALCRESGGDPQSARQFVWWRRVEEGDSPSYLAFTDIPI